MREAIALPSTLTNIIRIILSTLGTTIKYTDVHFQWALIGSQAAFSRSDETAQ